MASIAKRPNGQWRARYRDPDGREHARHFARKVDALNRLLTARTELHNLLSYMDGKTGAEDLIAKVLQDPALMKTLAAAPKPAEGGSADASK